MKYCEICQSVQSYQGGVCPRCGSAEGLEVARRWCSKDQAEVMAFLRGGAWVCCRCGGLTVSA